MFSLSDEGSFILPSSFNPPILPAPKSSSSLRLTGSPARVFLDSAAYIADRKNGTFAETTTRTGQAVGVSFWIADPPAVSHMCIHCPGMKVTDLMEEPIVVGAGKDIAVIRIAYTYGARPIESMKDLGVTDFDYLVYRAHTEKPSLELLPNPKPLFFNPREIGFLASADGGGDFMMAVIRPETGQLEYALHIFSSKTNSWTTRLVLLEPPSPRYEHEYLVHETDFVISVEGGTLGWVDLWRGIMLCNVLDSNPVLRYIHFPEPMAGNMIMYLQTCARAFRDVTCSNGFIRLIEIAETRMMVDAAKGSNGPRDRTIGTHTTESYNSDRWVAVTWKTATSSNRWTKDCTAYVSERAISPVLMDNNHESELENLVLAGPVWSMHEEDNFHLMIKADMKDKIAWAFTINVRKSTLEGVTSFPEGRNLFLKLEYHPFILSKYLNMTLGNHKVAASSQIQEREDSRNKPSNAMVLVKGLDPYVTENQLKDILSMFGEPFYLKLDAKERYALVQFARRSCAEEAIRL
ncbi:hypothetical protein HU200_025311 [Digitaria exilis]|uniref:RRM domain-containing protein n=1 Tax=Digitaria exilis TaxID=1010633 RepID=A0A835BX22_9POAL|nr:hypothetical protein HU200_025311 [Digitaria exilis]